MSHLNKDRIQKSMALDMSKPQETNMNMNKDYCVRKAFMDLQKTRYQPSLKETLNRIGQQGKQNKQKREEYEKTVRLLRLVHKEKEFVLVS